MWPPPIGKTTKQEKEMNRNCKPGDLAIVVDAYNPANIGTIVRVIRVHPNQGAMCKEPEDLLWFAAAPRPMSYDVGGIGKPPGKGVRCSRGCWRRELFVVG